MFLKNRHLIALAVGQGRNAFQWRTFLVGIPQREDDGQNCVRRGCLCVKRVQSCPLVLGILAYVVGHGYAPSIGLDRIQYSASATAARSLSQSTTGCVGIPPLGIIHSSPGFCQVKVVRISQPFVLYIDNVHSRQINIKLFTVPSGLEFTMSVSGTSYLCVLLCNPASTTSENVDSASSIIHPFIS